MTDNINSVPKHAKAMAGKYINEDGTSPKPASRRYFPIGTDRDEACSNRLPVLAAEIHREIDDEKRYNAASRRYERKSQEAKEQANARAERIGQLLLEAKALIPHGMWRSWLMSNFDQSESTAQKYMRLVKRRDEIETKSVTTGSRVTDLSTKARLASIARPRERAAPPTPEPEQIDLEDVIEAAAFKPAPDAPRQGIKFYNKITEIIYVIHTTFFQMEVPELDGEIRSMMIDEIREARRALLHLEKALESQGGKVTTETGE